MVVKFICCKTYSLRYLTKVQLIKKNKIIKVQVSFVMEFYNLHTHKNSTFFLPKCMNETYQLSK